MFCIGLTKSSEKTPLLFDQDNFKDKIVIFFIAREIRGIQNSKEKKNVIDADRGTGDQPQNAAADY